MNFNWPICALLICLSTSCGKRPIEKQKTQDYRPLYNERIPEFILNQDVICENPGECPAHIAKVTVINKKGIRYCTGTLIADDKIITSAQCLESSRRVPYIRCDENVYFSFPKVANLPAEHFRCHRILKVDRNITDTPSLWTSDIVVFQSYKRIKRYHAKIHRNGLNSLEDGTVWKVDYRDEFLGILKKSYCTPSRQNYLYPYSDSAYTPLFTTTNCDLNEEGNKGAAYFLNDRLVGIYSVKEKERTLNYLRAKKLIDFKNQDYFYFSNTSCSQLKNSTRNYVEKKCVTDISLSNLDRSRRNLLDQRLLHAPEMDKIKDKLIKKSKYFKWNPVFEEKSKSLSLKMGRPECILNIDKWIHEFQPRRNTTYSGANIYIEWPKYFLMTKLNRNLEVVTFLKKEGYQTFEVNFSPYNALVENTTDITIKLNNKIVNRYKNIVGCK